jgi:hypothetical protein
MTHARALDARGAMKRVVSAALTAALVLGACTGGEPTSRSYDARPQFDLSFRYPGDWTAKHFTWESSFSIVIVYLSDQPMITPCQGGSCGLAVEHLEAGGILAWWSEQGFPGWTFDHDAKGEPLTVGGRRAMLLVKPGCGKIDGEVSMIAVVEIPDVPDNWYQLNACIRGPGIDETEAQVRQMLHTVSFGATR